MLRVVGVARLTRDPESRQVGSTSVCTFSVVTSEKFKSKGEYKEKSTFFDVDVWGQQGQNAQNLLKKGDRIELIANLEQESWEKDGQKRSKLKGRLVDFRFVDARKKSPDDNASDNSENSEPSNDDPNVPF